GAAIHNMQVNGTDNTYEIDFCKTDGDSTACSDPEVIRGSESATITIRIDEAGIYNFRCDFHPTEMVGTLVVE
ncbi:MAG: cupredoxin domain-containing protein, partial [Chloroflexi bacterium]|nr:cupredoxin domain-containing protein [Chloroflexota bacterium]